MNEDYLKALEELNSKMEEAKSAEEQSAILSAWMTENWELIPEVEI